MKSNIVVLALLAIHLAFTETGSFQARAGTIFNFTFSATDGSGLSGSGILDAVLNPDGTSYTAVGGVGVVSGYAYGTDLSLIPNPSGSSGGYASPSGLFIYDDQLLPGQGSSLSIDGLLFGTNGNEISLADNGAGSVVFSDSVLNPLFGGPEVSFTLTMASVPEPSSVVLVGIAAMACIGLSKPVRLSSVIDVN